MMTGALSSGPGVYGDFRRLVAPESLLLAFSRLIFSHLLALIDTYRACLFFSNQPITPNVLGQSTESYHPTISPHVFPW